MESVFRLTVWLHKDPGTHVLNWDSLVLDWYSRFFTRGVPGLTIAICNKITAVTNDLSITPGLSLRFQIAGSVYAISSLGIEH